MLIDHMAQGLSFDSFAGLIGVSKDTLYEWLKHEKYSEFSYAKKIGSAKRNLFVEKMYVAVALGREIIDNDGKVLKPNTAMMIYWTKNTLGWTDKIEQSFDATTAPVFQLKYKIDE